MRRAVSFSAFFLGLAVFFCFALGTTRAQTTIRVPADFSTIQAAINAASPGDTVLVAPGTYVENINFLGKAITVESEGGPLVTIIDGNRAGVVATFTSGEGPNSVLRGFTLRNGQVPAGADGGGIRIANSSPTITGNRIIDNTGCTGIGIAIRFGSPIVQKNFISNNRQTTCSGGTGGGGIAVVGAGSAQILENNILNNTLTSAEGGGIALFAAGTPTIRGNVISGNSASGGFPHTRGGGIDIVNVSDALIVQNIITGNSAGPTGQGGGISWIVPIGGRGPFLVNNTIVNNDGPLGGSEVFADQFDINARLVNNIIVGRAGQTAVFCGNFNDLNPPIIDFNDVHAPGGTRYGGICTDQTGVNGNISADPLFVNASAGNFHLQAASPAIDAGNNSAPQLPSQDIDGQPRIQDGNGDGTARVDMGVDEFSTLQTFRDQPTFQGAAGTLTLINFDVDPCGNAIAAPSPGVLAGGRYTAVGMTFSAGVIFDSAAIGGSPPSPPNVISNTQINTPTPALVDATFASPVSAVGITNTGAEAILRVFDASNNLIGSITSDTNAGSFDFIGLISSVPIHRFQFDFVSGIGFAGDNLLFTRIATANCPPVANAGSDQTVNATSPAGAVIMLDGTGSSDPDGDPLTFTWTGPFGSVSGPTPSVTVPVGAHTITLTVTDPGGLSDTDTVQVTVQAAGEQVGDLISTVQGLGLSSGIENSLVAKLQNALTSINLGNKTAACGQLNAFINQVRALARSGALTPGDASGLIVAANQIKAVLGCP